MALFYQSVISIISRPSERRRHEDIDLVLPWFLNFFKKKSSIFGDIDSGKPFSRYLYSSFSFHDCSYVISEIVRDMIKNCSFETRHKDEIIIKQGDVGEV
jgi:hypothetical protein